MSRGWRSAIVARAHEDSVAGEVSRLVLDVTLPDGRRGLVTIALHDGALVAVDDRGERSSELARAGLAWLATLVREVPERVSGALVAVRTSFPPVQDDPLEELALDLVRSGIAGARRGALEDALRAARSLTDPRTTRWLARFEAALADADVDNLASLALGALVRRPSRTESRVDLRLVELARERVDGIAPRRIERRYLVDLADGALLLEEHDVAFAHGTLGPMPRLVEAGLVEVHHEPGAARARILQYTTSPRLEASALSRIAELAEVRVEACLARVARALEQSPGWAEPFVLFAPRQWQAPLRFLDDEGRALPFSREEDPAACALLAEVATRQRPRWVALRACPRHGSHAFVPLSCALERDGTTEIVRLRG